MVERASTKSTHGAEFLKRIAKMSMSRDGATTHRENFLWPASGAGKACGGSGRDMRGSFRLNEFTVSMARPGEPPGHAPMPVKLKSAAASFERTGTEGLGPGPINSRMEPGTSSA